MTHVIVDSNIIFASLLLKHSALREKLSNQSFHYYAPKFLFVELFKHKERILKHSKATEDEVLEFLSLALHHIHFINEDVISTRIYLEAFALTKDIDEKDTPFVAMSIALQCKLWTRDEELKSGLRKKGFDNFLDESELDN